MKKTICILIAIWVFITQFSFAQFNLPKFIAPSPNAYSLGKYGDVPVGLYTGVPNINIPVHTLSDHEIGLNISLSYHGGGVKIDEEASDIGLSWSLNAGGAITRVVNGLEDEVFTRKEIPMQSVTNYSSMASFINLNQLSSAFTGSYDTEPDVFYFNFNGRTGKFSFDKNGNVLLHKREDLDITMVSSGPYTKKIIIKDEKGLVYEFNDRESRPSPDFSRSVTCTWYLSSITSPTGRTITFQYTPKGGIYHLARAGKNYTLLPVSNSTVNFGPPLNPIHDGPDYGNQIQELRLSKIVSTDGSVDFIYKTTGRLDLVSNNDSPALDAIVIYKPDQTVLKKVKLYTGYFEANNGHKYNMTNISANQFLNYRLRLDSVREFSAADIAMQPAHKFSYQGDDNPATDDAFTLPYRLSPEQDHWGYYNQSYNAHLYPANIPASMVTGDWYSEFLTFQTAGYGITPLTTFYQGANRNPHADAMKAGMLKRVFYPTGGYSDLEFEPNANAATMTGGIRIKNIKTYPVNGLQQENSYTYQDWSDAVNPENSYYEYLHAIYPKSVAPFNPLPWGANGPELVLPYPLPLFSVMNIFGLPLEATSQRSQGFVKIQVTPQAILGSGSQIGYDVVRVTQPGNGYTETVFDSKTLYPDYNGENGPSEGPGEIHLLNNLFATELVDDGTSPSTPATYPYSSAWLTKFVNTYKWPYLNTVDNSWKRGVETSRWYYSEANVLLKTESWDYSRKLIDFIPSSKLIQIREYTPATYLFGKTGIPSGLIQLTKTITTNYDKNGQNPVTDAISYYYDSPQHLQVTRTERKRSGGKTITAITTFPKDYAAGTPFIDDMVANHLYFPIEQVSYINDGSNYKLLSGNITTYKTGGNGLKDAELIAEFTGPLLLNNFKFSNRTMGNIPPLGSSLSFARDGSYKIRANFENFDNYGNVVQLSEQYGAKTSYLWGYNGKYPIAKFENASYNDVKTALNDLSETFITAVKNKPEPSASDFALINALRTHPGLSKASIQTFTFKPAVGVSSETGTNGKTVFYEYDNFHRLKAIRDQQGSIIKQYDYNYKQP